MILRRRVLPLIVMVGALTSVPARAEQKTRVHEVEPGETLWTIAADAMGDARLWPAIYRANRDQIKDPALVYPGQRLSIPAIDPAMREALRSEAASQPAR
ncbi:MAG: LysM peptidoglycan-binding domain-containing protein [Deltaproteobacteria bacterium]|nr:MAG: LysM peptidoglycan-binding domain-containing protein [Deltaproteobacteria bacterium]